MREKTLEDVGEAGALKAIQRYVHVAGAAVEVGFGDDAAAIRLPNGEFLLVTTDMLVEGVHFPAQGVDWVALGRKAFAVNASDIAAMGGRAEQAVISIGLPISFPISQLKALYRGLAGEARRCGAVLIGGDTVRAPQPVINVALFGRHGGKTPLPLRSRCRPGQSLYVTGTLGDSAAGLAILLRPEFARFGKTAHGRALLRRHSLPTARLAAGQALGDTFGDLAMIDVSDGLRRECDLFAQESKVGLRVNAAALPLSPALRRWCAEAGQDARAFALDGGEDYELLFTTKASIEQIRRLFERRKIRLRVTRIGEIAAGQPAVRVENEPGQRVIPFEHF